MWSIINKIRRFFWRTEVPLEVTEFIHAHPNLLFIVCDPDMDSIVTSYRDITTATRINPEAGRTRSRVIKEILSMSRVNNSIDRFLMQIDGAVWNLAKAHRDRRKAKRDDIQVGPPDVPTTTAYA